MPKIVDPEERREAIAYAACRAIAKRGFDRATMADIAAEAGYTTGMVTHYFGSKHDVLCAALRVVLKRMEARCERRISRGEDKLFAILKEALPIDARRRAECAVWIGFWGRVPQDTGLAEINRQVHEEAEDLYTRAIQAAWPESHDWPTAVFAQAHRSILTFVNGVIAGACHQPAELAGPRPARTARPASDPDPRLGTRGGGTARGLEGRLITCRRRNRTGTPSDLDASRSRGLEPYQSLQVVRETTLCHSSIGGP